jgi:hypothetical protein
MLKDFNDRLKVFTPYIGYFDVTYSSNIKTYISTILTHSFVKSKNRIIVKHEDDRDNTDNINNTDYPFKENQFICKSLQSMYYNMFLSYKIERKIFEGFESDRTFSLNSITEEVLNIENFEILVEENKLKNYLLIEKFSNLKRAGLHEMTTDQLEILIKDKIKDDYIYNLSFSSKYETVKFNIILEIDQGKLYEKTKILASLEYLPLTQTLRLITMI